MIELDLERCIIDTSAWIEFFKGSEDGKLVREFILRLQNEPTVCYTPTVVIAEFKKKYVDFGYSSERFDEDLERIKYLSTIDQISEHVAINAGKLRGESEESNISIIDYILLAMGKNYNNCKVLSKDRHIKNKEEGIYIDDGVPEW